MKFKIIKQDEKTISVIVYLCLCLDDNKESLITEPKMQEMLAQGHEFTSEA